MQHKVKFLSTVVIVLLLFGMLGCPTNGISPPMHVVYVDKEGSGDGTSWQSAMADLQQAIEVAHDNATASEPWEVWV